MRVVRLISLFVLEVALFAAAPFAKSQNGPARVPRQIVDKIDENQLIALSGNTLPVANSQNDLGQVRPDLSMTDLVLVLSRSPEQQAAFDAFVASQYDPSSPTFHQWLAPAEVGEKFGPAAADLAVISNWLASHGLSVAEVSKDRMAIRFGGSAAQVESTFHVEIHDLKVNGQAHIGNMSDPQIPVALAPVVAGVKALNDFHPHPLHRLGSKVQFDSSTGRWQRIPGEAQDSASPDLTGVHPEFGITVPIQGDGSYPIEDVSPYDFATVYNVLPLWNASTPIDGTGQTIAIVATSDVNPADVASYRSLFGLPAGPALNTIDANGQAAVCLPYGSCPADEYENTLDVEVSGAVAKGAQIDLVVSGPTSPTTDQVYSSASYVIENDTAKIMSLSYGQCELFLGTSGNAAYNNLWETAAVEGIGVFVAAGDAGSATCDQGLESSVPYGAQDGLSVSGVASSPYDTAVGGTDFAWCKPTVNSSGDTVGCSSGEPYWGTSDNATNGESALNYVPEIPWNDSCASPQAAAYLESVASFIKVSGVSGAEKACNFVVNNWSSIDQEYGVDLAAFVTSVGGGGGASNCTVNSTTSSTVTPDPASCSGGYAKPSWQAAVTGIPSGGGRDIPDVSFFAGNGLWDSATIICESEAGSCVSSLDTDVNPTAQEVGGTSVSAPEMAGVMALINQKAGAPQGNPNAELYALAAKQNSSSCSAETVKTNSTCYFNDIDTGTNAVPCESGALNCSVAHSSDTWGILSGFSATKGFDESTGLGSLNVANVVNGWSSIGGTAAATVTITTSQNTISIDQSLIVTVSVTGSSGTPTGNVGLQSSGYIGTPGPLSGGSYTFTIPAYSLAAGNYTLTISYGGDSTYAESSATTTVTVTKILPTVTVTSTPSAVGANAILSVAVTVSGAGPTPTGTIQLSGIGNFGANCTLTSGACTMSAYSDSMPSGTDTLTAAYSGDNIYVTTTATATVTVNTLKPTVTVVPSLASLDTATPLQLAVTVSGTGATPTGTVILSLCEAYLGSGTLTNGTYTFAISPGFLSPGSNTFTVCYTGDTTYIPANGAATVAVTKGTLPLTATPSATSMTTNNTLTITGTLGANLFFPTLLTMSYLPTGTITVSSGGTVVGSTYMAGLSTNYSITIPPDSLSAGTDALTVNYGGSLEFNPSSAATTVTVAQWTQVAPTLTITSPASTDTDEVLQVQGAVGGAYGTPTGSVTVTSGGSSWGPYLLLSDGTYQVPITPYQLPVGTDALTVNYSGDATYLAASGSASVTVIQSVFALSATTPPTISPGSQATSTISISSSTNYGSPIALSCALTSGPSNQTSDSPTCTLPSGFFLAGGSTTAIVTTVAPTSGALIRPEFPSRNRTLAAGATALALLILFGIPARRRRWRQMLGALVLVAAMGALASCGGGGGGGGGCTSNCGGDGNPGTAAGAYTFTVTGTGNPAVTPAPTATFTVTVN